MPHKYDVEVDHTWQLILFDGESSIESGWSHDEITPDYAAQQAYRLGYDTFEIVHSVTTTIRYELDGDVE